MPISFSSPFKLEYHYLLSNVLDFNGETVFINRRLSTSGGSSLTGSSERYFFCAGLTLSLLSDNRDGSDTSGFALD